MNDYLQHYGVLGMRWGRRKGSEGHSDHSEVSLIRKKGLRNMTDSELRKATNRMRLVSEYKRTNPHLGGKRIKDMSNDDLIKATNRGKLKQEQWKNGLALKKRIDKMTDQEVKIVLDRVNLERPYKQLEREERDKVRKLVKFLITGDF